MTRAAAAAIVLVLILGGCRDPSTDEVHEYLTVLQGGTLESTTESDDTYSLPEDYSLYSELEDLPAGFHFHIDDEYFDGGHLVVEYTLSIEHWVPTGTYQFELKYRIRDRSEDSDLFDDLFEAPDEIDFNFQVFVSPRPVGDPPQTVIIRGVRVENPDQETTLIILE